MWSMALAGRARMPVAARVEDPASRSAGKDFRHAAHKCLHVGRTCRHVRGRARNCLHIGSRLRERWLEHARHLKDDSQKFIADTRVQLDVEDWVRTTWMLDEFGQKFRRERLPLRSGGRFDFDAVSADEKIIATISTSSSLTSSGKYGVGKMMKLRSDMLFLIMAAAERRLVVLTEEDMYKRCLAEVGGGRVPPETGFVLAVLPAELRTRLDMAKAKSSAEVSPK